MMSFDERPVHRCRCDLPVAGNYNRDESGPWFSIQRLLTIRLTIE